MIGVLALQGAFQKHLDCLKKLGVSAKLIKHPQELEKCTGLILPGGETTTHLKLLEGSMWQALIEFGQVKPIFGTCCGMILLAKHIQGDSISTLGLMDITVARNAYGRQIDSFQDQVEVFLNSRKMQVDAFFIRAPQIVSVGQGIEILAHYQNIPVLVRNHLHIACAFHPEISLDIQLHEVFVNHCNSLALTL